METIKKDHLEINYVVHIKKIKNTYFRIKNNQLVVTTNKYTSKKVIQQYLLTKFELFHQRLKTEKEKELEYEITLWNHKYQIILINGNFQYRFNNNQIIIHSKSTDINKIKKEVLKKETEIKLNEVHFIVLETIKKSGLSPLPIKLKYLRSKFGSYHRKDKEITLNTFLARLDSIYLTYVLYHEYAHALVFNHSKDFYNLLSLWMPNHKLYQKDLKKIAII